jgi:hypothetical protein
MKENRRGIIENMAQQRPQSRSVMQSQTLNSNSLSNVNILQEISKDEDYFRNHRMYEEISNAYNQAIGPIMAEAQSILAIGSEVQLYKDEECNRILADMRNNFFNDTKEIYDRELGTLVTQVRYLIDDNNMVLKGLNVDDPRTIDLPKSYDPQRQSQMSNGSAPNNQPKRRRVETEGSHPYGLEYQSNHKHKSTFNS